MEVVTQRSTSLCSRPGFPCLLVGRATPWLLRSFRLSGRHFAGTHSYSPRDLHSLTAADAASTELECITADSETV